MEALEASSGPSQNWVSWFPGRGVSRRGPTSVSKGSERESRISLEVGKACRRGLARPELHLDVSLSVPPAALASCGALCLSRLQEPVMPPALNVSLALICNNLSSITPSARVTSLSVRNAGAVLWARTVGALARRGPRVTGLSSPSVRVTAWFLAGLVAGFSRNAF